jgi:hypothetical protein
MATIFRVTRDVWPEGYVCHGYASTLENALKIVQKLGMEDDLDVTVTEVMIDAYDMLDVDHTAVNTFNSKGARSIFTNREPTKL